MAHPSLCIVTHTFLPHVGGIENVVFEQGKRLLQRGFELKVITNRIGTKKNYVINGIPVQCYDSLNVGFRLGIPYAIPDIASYKTFFNVIKSCDLVHVHGHPYLSSFIAGMIAWRYSKPLVVTQHNTFIEYDSLWNIVETINDIVVGRPILNVADKIIAVSNATKNYVLSLGADPQKISVIHNGVDLVRFRVLDGIREKMRQKLGLDKDSFVILTVRRLVYKNGIDTLLESARIAITKNSQIVFVVVGSGPDSGEIKEKIGQLGMRDNFRLAGFVSDEDLPLYYNTADLFVLPSKSGEGLPLVALEAMACGLPVVATKVGGIAEIMMEGCGKLVPPNDPDSMADAMLFFSSKDLGDVKKRVRLSAQKKYGWDSNVEKLVKIYEELI